MRYLYTMIAAAALLLLGTMPATAEDQVWGDWVALDTDDGTDAPYPGTWSADLEPVDSATSSIVSPTEAVLVYPEDGPNLGTSIEVTDLGLNVEAGTAEVTWQLEDGAAVAPGAPRLFVFVDGKQYNTFRDGTTTDTGASMDIPAGTVGYAGVAYDNGVPGTVRVSGVSISGTPVLFAEPAPEPEPEPSETADPDPEPTKDDTQTDTDTDTDTDPTPVPTAVPAGAELPKTGISPLLGTGAGIALLLAGGALLLARRQTS